MNYMILGKSLRMYQHEEMLIEKNRKIIFCSLVWLQMIIYSALHIIWLNMNV